ncbi:hypothetical protein TraAM80_09367, partial [Trypanosoma rangeli]
MFLFCLFVSFVFLIASDGELRLPFFRVCVACVSAKVLWQCIIESLRRFCVVFFFVSLVFPLWCAAADVVLCFHVSHAVCGLLCLPLFIVWKSLLAVHKESLRKIRERGGSMSNDAAAVAVASPVKKASPRKASPKKSAAKKPVKRTAPRKVAKKPATKKPATKNPATKKPATK